MAKPNLHIEDWQGRHNLELAVARARLDKGKTYRDLSTVIVCPAIAPIPARIVGNWMGLIKPANQKVIGPLFIEEMEVGEAYNLAIEQILDHPELSQYKYLLTMETDNAPPPDGLLKLYESIDDYHVVSGLYWTKGEGGVPQIWGDPNVFPKNFIPQMPQPETVQPCNGTGMGFALWRLEIFKNPDLEKPWFKTHQSYEPGVGSQSFSQDLWFANHAGKCGIKFAVDTRIKVGHFDGNIMW